jgi:uncharacterized protein (DUF2147 family)
MLKYVAFIILFITSIPLWAANPEDSDQICGKWMSSEKNIIVQVYKTGEEFKAKVVWFHDDDSKPMDEWRDKHNPDPALRSRRLVGMEILRNLKYDKSSHTWEDGMIYDAQHGREWNAAAYIDKQGMLRIKGYWHLKLFGKTMIFQRI